MATIDKITLVEGETTNTYPIQDSATAELAESIKTAVDGKPVASITYEPTATALNINTSTIAISTAASADLNARAASTVDGDIDTIILDGNVHSLTAANGDIKYTEVVIGALTFTTNIKLSSVTTRVNIPLNRVINIEVFTPNIGIGPVAHTVVPYNTYFIIEAFTYGGMPTSASDTIIARIYYTDTDATFVEPS